MLNSHWACLHDSRWHQLTRAPMSVWSPSSGQVWPRRSSQMLTTLAWPSLWTWMSGPRRLCWGQSSSSWVSCSVWFENFWRFWAQLALCSPCFIQGCSLFNFSKIWEILSGGSHCWSLPIDISFTSGDLHLTIVAVLQRWHGQFYFYLIKFKFCMIMMIFMETNWITWALKKKNIECFVLRGDNIWFFWGQNLQHGLFIEFFLFGQDGQHTIIYI